MPLRRVSTYRVTFLLALLEIGFGLIWYMKPAEFTDRPQYTMLLPFLSSSFLLGGITLLIMLRHAIAKSWRRALVVVPVIPLAAVGWKMVEVGEFGGGSVFSLLALGTLAIPWVDSDEAGKGQGDMLDAALGVVYVGGGLAMLVGAGDFALPHFGYLIPYIRPMGGLVLLGGAALFTRLWVPDRGGVVALLWRRALPAISPLLFGMAFLLTGLWSGAFFALLAAAVVLLADDLPVQQFREGAHDPEDPMIVLERTVETWSWILLPSAVIMALADDMGRVRLLLPVGLFVVFIATYNLVAYWLLARVGRPSVRMCIHLVVFTLGVLPLMMGDGMVGHSTILLLVIPPMLGARALGERAGYWLLGGALAVLTAAELVQLLQGGTLTGFISHWLVKGVLLLTVGIMATVSAAEQRRLTVELSSSQEELQAANEELQAQGEELLAQQESLIAHNEALERTSRAFAHLASHDPLTNLLNRRRFQEELEEELQRASTRRGQGALLFLDLDRFKLINDSFGHTVGDQVLQQIARVLTRHVGPKDLVARLSGDEFAILLPDSSADRAYLVAAKLLEDLRSQNIRLHGAAHRVSASIGVTLYPEQGLTVEELLMHADMAMYAVKDTGRDGYRLYEADDKGRLELQVYWEQEIRAALEEDRFVLHVQPIVGLADGATVRYEVLLRMVGRQGELIRPGVFLPVAEASSLIQAIDRWVVAAAIRLLQDWKELRLPVGLEVNLSGRAFSDPGLLPLVKELFHETGADPAQVVFEITETAAITDMDSARGFIATLRELGCGFAIDDFGVGFSSFAYLKHLQPDYLKIDGSLVQELLHNDQDRHLIQAIVSMSRGLGVRTVAEFVEDEATLQMLKEMGVDLAQGYHLGRPKPISHLTDVSTVG